MNDAGSALAAAAATFIDTPFRLRGRDPATGIDCIGLLAAALGKVGRAVSVPASYSLRQTGIEHLLDYAWNAGLRDVAGPQLPGDVLVVRPGPAQFHILIWADPCGYIHAHAGLGRAVLSPPPLSWPIERHWRLKTY